MPSNVIVERATTGTMELRRHPFEIVLDGKPAGTIDRDQTVELSVEPGRHTLQVRAGRYTSPTESFDGSDGASTRFLCNGAVFWPHYVLSLVIPGIGLKLKRQ
jgi:hypothetical protein